MSHLQKSGTFRDFIWPVAALYAAISPWSIGVERLDCKRPILWLASSKILTPHPPHRLASVYPLPLELGEDTLAGWRGGWGVNILEETRHSSVLYVCKYFVLIGFCV
jgi:hypothetical protein